MLSSNLLPTNLTITEAATALHLHIGNTAKNTYKIQTQSYPETKDNRPGTGSGAVEGHS
jgi:type IV secretory pathway VirB9-like protein